MTLTTNIRIIGDDISTADVYCKARQIIGIPRDRSTNITHPAPTRTRLLSEPGGFKARLAVTKGAHDDLDTYSDHDPEIPNGPVWDINVYLDSDGTVRGRDKVHRDICARLGAWLEANGADWWAQDEYTGEWHHRTPCPLVRPEWGEVR